MSKRGAEKFFEFKKTVRSRFFAAMPGQKGDLSGAEFEAVRPYEPGDPVSAVNHAASALHGTLMVSIKRPGRELQMVFLFDTTSSMLLGKGDTGKCSVARRFFRAGAEAAKDHQASFVLLHALDSSKGGFSEYPMHEGSPEYLEKQFAEFLAQHAGKEGAFDLAKAFALLERRGVSRTLFVAVVSDFLFPADYGDSLKKFLTGDHHVVGAAVLDPAEREIPKLSFGALRVRDSETGVSALIARPPAHYLDQHKALWNKHRATLEVV